MRVTIKQAAGLPPSLSHFVFCQYSLWGSDEVVVPPVVADGGDDEEDRIGVRNRLRLEDGLGGGGENAKLAFNHTREAIR